MLYAHVVITGGKQCALFELQPPRRSINYGKTIVLEPYHATRSGESLEIIDAQKAFVTANATMPGYLDKVWPETGIWIDKMEIRTAMIFNYTTEMRTMVHGP